MFRSPPLFRCVWVLALGTTGCVTSNTVRSARTQPELGTTVTFERPCAEHWEPVLATAHRLKWRLEEQDPSERLIVADVPMSGWTWGEHVSVLLREDGPSCNIQVYSRRDFPLNATATNWEEEFFERYAPPGRRASRSREEP